MQTRRELLQLLSLAALESGERVARDINASA